MKHRTVPAVVMMIALMLACNLPAAAPSAGTQATATSTTQPAGAPPPSGPSGPTVPLAAPNGQALNCRSGPDTAFPVIGILSPGQTVEIVGRNADASWLYVKDPFSAGSFCWISASFATISGDTSGVPVVAAPPPPPTSSALPVASVKVNDVDVSVSPDNISVPGCIGPILPSTISATITVNGAIKIHWRFKTDQNGTLTSHADNFNKPTSRIVSDTFTPPLTAGKYEVSIVIDGQDLSGMKTTASYKISC